MNDLGRQAVDAPPPTPVVGVDLVSVRDVEDSVQRFGQRYLDRVYTAHEQQISRSGDRVLGQTLAGRFAGKEAVLKALRPQDQALPWTHIELRRAAGGACDVVLHGAARELARRCRIESVSVSLTHEAGLAMAVAVAVPTARKV